MTLQTTPARGPDPRVAESFADETLLNLNATLAQSQADLSRATIIWGTKGFDRTSGQLLSQTAREIMGEDSTLGVISGPSFARETAARLPTALTLACSDGSRASDLAQWFRTDTTRVYYSDDLIGVQLGGAVKNVLAIAAGICDGLGFGANARAALVTRGLSELTRLGIAMGGKAETFMGLTGIGDLILTCTDDQSRNRRYGLGLGRGQSHDTVVTQIGQEIEGINTVHELIEIARKHDVEMPIAEQVYRVIYNHGDPEQAVQSLLQRDPKSESF